MTKRPKSKKKRSQAKGDPNETPPGGRALERVKQDRLARGLEHEPLDGGRDLPRSDEDEDEDDSGAEEQGEA